MKGPVHIKSVSLTQAEVVLFDKHHLVFNLTFDESELQPLFSGSCWAGTVVWKASLFLCQHLENFPIKGKCVLELGAGIGLPGTVAAYLGGKQVILTEQAPLTKLLEQNVSRNFQQDLSSNIAIPRVMELDWNNEVVPVDAEVDYILISDCIYKHLYGDSWKKLAEVIKRLRIPGKTTILNSVERRNDDGIEEFLAYSTELGINWKLLDKIHSREGEELELYICDN